MPSSGGVLHCYSEDWEYARKILDQHDNMYFSFAGNVTYRNARNLHDTVRYLPLDRILIESESPFMVPAAYRGKRNKPMYLPSTAQFIASLREEPEEEVYQTLFDNARALFGLVMGSLYHPLKIGNIKTRGNIFLAPLAGYTDRAFRSVSVLMGSRPDLHRDGFLRGSYKTQ